VTGAYPVLHVGSFGLPDRVRPARPWARTFRGTPASVPEARRFVAELLAGCPAREVLMTCVSELCANAIMHTASGDGGAFTVEVDLPRPGVARIAVTDEGGPSLPTPGRLDPTAGRPDLPADRLDPTADRLDPTADRLDPMAEGGRGLAIVAACTSRWGYADADRGRTVWAEACWPIPVPAPDQDASADRPRRSRTSLPLFGRRSGRWPPRDVPPGPAA
jgi:anti-sigma regulatory factor (Ser/Thr protein kinase)